MEYINSLLVTFYFILRKNKFLKNYIIFSRFVCIEQNR